MHITQLSELGDSINNLMDFSCKYTKKIPIFTYF